MIKHEYIKHLDALRQIKKICEENDFGNRENQTWALRNINDITNDLVSKVENLKEYEKLDADCDVNGNLRLAKNCGIYNCKEITNVGKIKQEILLRIEFPTGAYIFGDDYDVEYFDRFYEELKDIEPKYEDRVNRKIYYSFENGIAYQAYSHFKNTLKKYNAGYKERKKHRRIEELKKELAQLESNK